MTKALAYRIILLFSACFTLFVAEILIRIFLPPPQIVLISEDLGFKQSLAMEHKVTRAFTSNMWPEDDVFVQTPRGIRLRANVHALIVDRGDINRTISLRTNSIGYRNPEIRQKERKRVLFLGDSITLGVDVEEEETFVRLVEKLSMSGPEPLETINAGVNGLSLQNELAILEQTGIALQPDIVIIGFFLNDALPSPGVKVAKIPWPLDKFRLFYYVFKGISTIYQYHDYSRINRETWDQWKREITAAFPPGPGDPLNDRAALNALILENATDWGSAWSNGAWERMDPLFAEFKRLAGVHNFKLGIVIFPVKDQIIANFVYDYPQQRLKEIAKKLDVPVLDPLPALREIYRSSPEALLYDHAHYTPYGHTIIAGLIFDFLKNYFSLTAA